MADRETPDPASPARRAMLKAGGASTLLFASGLSAQAESRRAPLAHPSTLRVNGTDFALKLDPRTTLLDALREHLALPGSKKGCDHGQCGACTVLVNGRRINACLTLAAMHEGDEITTIEGLASGETLHPVQAAFIARDGFQCGYCTPGQIVSAVGMLAEARAAGVALTEAEIRERMSGNICRCAAYPNIVAAIRDAAKEA
jgi:xanthine dehydrogenase YagT iron-sulfur-binding subunit